jgi:hypothetical protein
MMPLSPAELYRLACLAESDATQTKTPHPSRTGQCAAKDKAMTATLRFDHKQFIQTAVSEMKNERNPLMFGKFSDSALIMRVMGDLKIDIDNGIEHDLTYEEYLEVQQALILLKHDVEEVVFEQGFYRLA